MPSVLCPHAMQVVSQGMPTPLPVLLQAPALQASWACPSCPSLDHMHLSARSPSHTSCAVHLVVPCCRPRACRRAGHVCGDVPWHHEDEPGGTRAHGDGRLWWTGAGAGAGKGSGAAGTVRLSGAGRDPQRGIGRAGAHGDDKWWRVSRAGQRSFASKPLKIGVTLRGHGEQDPSTTADGVVLLQ